MNLSIHYLDKNEVLYEQIAIQYAYLKVYLRMPSLYALANEDGILNA